MLQVLVAISLKFYYRKEEWGYAKVIHKKRRKKKKELRKNGQVSEIFKTMGTQMLA
jgi:hypothetical protein